MLSVLATVAEAMAALRDSMPNADVKAVGGERREAAVQVGCGRQRRPNLKDVALVLVSGL